MISGTYEYLISSLPNLSFQNTEETKRAVLDLLNIYGGGETGALSPIEILDNEARKFMPAPMFHVFRRINLSNIHKAEFQNTRIRVLCAFSKSTFELKKEIEAWRLPKNGSENDTDENDIDKIVGDGTHLEKEIQILKYQWRELEDISTGHFSSLEAVFSYKIKLLLLQRWWSFDVEKGFERFTRMTHDN